MAIAGLVAALAVALFLYFDMRRRYQNAVLCSTMQAQNVERFADAPDARRSDDDLLCGAVHWMRVFEMRDKKTATMVFQITDNHPQILKQLSPETLEYIRFMESKWGGKELGFPDKW